MNHYVRKIYFLLLIIKKQGEALGKAEAAELMKPEVRKKIADAHVAAILEIEKSGL